MIALLSRDRDRFSRRAIGLIGSLDLVQSESEQRQYVGEFGSLTEFSVEVCSRLPAASISSGVLEKHA
jgi:hypothetical protein